MKRTSLVARAIVVALCATLAFGVSAQARSYNVGTALTLTGPDQINSGVAFTLRARLESPRRFCVKNSDVWLYADGSLVDMETTGRKGWVIFAIENGITSRTTYHAEFDGKVAGPHTDTKVCRSSSSNAVTVRLR